ncbi:MAG: DUF6174 domain-containing protein [Chloroflexi bacterium]|nr:DUF6174 domain-containing protein [Chloroflexota bacterium]
MNRLLLLVSLIVGAVAMLAACSSEPKPASPPTAVPTATTVVVTSTPLPIVPEDAQVDRKAAMSLGIDLHRQLWSTRPSDSYKFGFQWNVGDHAYERANVEVRIVKGLVDKVVWASNAIKTDGSEPADFVVPEQPDIASYYSIDGLFRMISEAIENDPVSVTLGFDSVFGFPTAVDIVFPRNSEHEDLSFFAAQLIPLPGPPQ